MKKERIIELEEIARNMRGNILKAINKAGSGHPGGSLSIADILTVLYFERMNLDPKNPDLKNRDKLILSKGHGAPCQYVALAMKGYFPVSDVLTLRKIDSKFQGHPDKNKVRGIEMSTGSLGQGFSASCGMALSNKLDGLDSMVYVVLGDGELQEGIVWEASMAASHYKLSNLCAFIDWNGLQIDGKNEDVMTVKPIDEKFKSFGWNVLMIDGHNIEEINNAIDSSKASDKPTAVICKTLKGKGVSFMEDNANWHGKAPNDEELKKALEELEVE